jgi:hypothetical protein
MSQMAQMGNNQAMGKEPECCIARLAFSALLTPRAYGAACFAARLLHYLSGVISQQRRQSTAGNKYRASR